MSSRSVTVTVFSCLSLLASAAAYAAPAGTGASSPAKAALPAALRPVLYQALARDAGPAYAIGSDGCVALPKQRLRACFGNTGVRFAGADKLSLHLAAWGRGSALHRIKAVKPLIADNRARYVHPGVSEWWRVLPMGFEQGFTVAKRPAGNGELTLALAASDNAKIKDGVLAFGALRYGKLVVTDANGKLVPSSLKVKDGEIRIAVNDARAAYPLTVDPLVWLQQKVTASDGAAFDSFGNAVALSGTTALVGAPGATGSQGAAYVFDDSSGTWTQTAKITASDGAANDYFGLSVALSGTTALIGAPDAAVGGNSNQGAAYVFDDSSGTWTQTAKLTASDGAAFDSFGYSVALSGTTALVGALDATVGGNTSQGAAYVFDDSSGTWTQTAKLTASDGAAFDAFGVSVALSGTTALIGAPDATVGGNSNQGAAYVFDDSSGTWTQTAKITASDGAANDEFGYSVAHSGTTALVGALYATVGGNSQQGAAYVFDDSGGTWTQTAKLTASDGAANDSFGYSVALSGTTALIGAPAAAVGGNYAQGAAYVFDDSGGAWNQTRKLTASDGAANDSFGASVARLGTTALVGALAATANGNEFQGAAYSFATSDLDLAMSAPTSVAQNASYSTETIVTNASSAASPAVIATAAAPAAASLLGASASQGSCTVTSTLATCDLGAISGNAGTATMTLNLKAAGAAGDTIHNTARVSNAAPALTASAPTLVATCPDGYASYASNLGGNTRAVFAAYHAPAGEENAVLVAPAGFRMFVITRTRAGRKTYVIAGTEVHRNAPAGFYAWGVHANSNGGHFTLCLLHP